APAEAPDAVLEPGRVHLVVVSTQGVSAGETAPAGAVLRTRFWHPRDRRWSENFFESLDHALHLFVEESGWVLRQQQALDRPHAHELIFEARRQDFSRPSAEEMLRDVGLTPRDVAGLFERVDAEPRGE
ncbi:MAG TPA: hypothetical protein VEL76_24580, partial [Gemmataceae bacterium]|nr:hypothetical protein [Gemmataceae bacterium]